MLYNKHMEKFTIKTDGLNEKFVLDKYEIFHYKCEEKKVVGRHIYITYSRDDSLPFIGELKELEKEYGDYHIGSMAPTYILPIPAFILITIFLILFLVNKDLNLVICFCSLIIPALICIVLAFIFMFLRMRTVSQIEKEKPEKDKEYRIKVDKVISRF